MKISKEKKNKIFEQILNYLYSVNPRPIFTSYIAREIARDEEFVKKLLLALKKKNLVIELKKNNKGVQYKRRSRWVLSPEAYQAFKKRIEI